MTTNREDAVTLMLEHPARVAQACGYHLLKEELHGAWIRSMILGKDDLTLLAHRCSYKTTCLAMSLAMLMLLRPEESILLMRKTENGAAEILRQVKIILSQDAMQRLSAALYGEGVKVKSTALGMSCDCYAAKRGAYQLTGCGTSGSITGRHAERIFTDDIVDLRDRVSEQERERTRGIYMELQNVRIRGGRLVNIGTPWHKQDAISLMPGVVKYDCYHTGLMDDHAIRTLRESMSPSLFAANYELRHIASEDALFPTAAGFFTEENLLWDGMAHIDAAYGGDDYTAMTCAKREGEEIRLYGRLWRGHVEGHLEEILAECDRFRCGPILCETNADKGYLAKELRQMGAQVRMYREGSNKYVKIATWLKKWWPHIRFYQGTDPEYLAQILDYTINAAHDDAPDSAACMCRALERGR
jgi:hypothetical protein